MLGIGSLLVLLLRARKWECGWVVGGNGAWLSMNKFRERVSWGDMPVELC
jgi:hypothetical protein